MALADNIAGFATTLSAAPPAETTVLAAHAMAQQIAQHFAFATLDGVDIALGSNLSEPAIQALTARLIVAFVISGDHKAAAAEVMEQAFLDYLNNGPISDMWPAAVEATKDGPDLHKVMTEATEGTEGISILARRATATGITQWITSAVKVELDEVPPRFEWVV